MISSHPDSSSRKRSFEPPVSLQAASESPTDPSQTDQKHLSMETLWPRPPPAKPRPHLPPTKHLPHVTKPHPHLLTSHRDVNRMIDDIHNLHTKYGSLKTPDILKTNCHSKISHLTRSKYSGQEIRAQKPNRGARTSSGRRRSTSGTCDSFYTMVSK